MTIETVVRPFVGESVAARAYIAPGGVPAAPIRIGPIGLPGGTKVFSFSSSGSMTTYMAAVHKERNVSAYDYSSGQMT